MASRRVKYAKFYGIKTTNIATNKKTSFQERVNKTWYALILYNKQT